MDALQFFLLRYGSLHTSNEADLLRGLTDDQLRRGPQPGINSIAWLLWHMTRCEDVGINRLVADHPQVLDDERWADRLGMPVRHIGTGMADGEVTGFSASVDIQALLAYRAAVGRRTLEIVSALHPERLDDVLDLPHLRRVAAEGTLGEQAAWVEDLWHGKTRGWFLAQLGLTHNHSHMGEAFLVRGLLGHRKR